MSYYCKWQLWSRVAGARRVGSDRYALGVGDGVASSTSGCRSPFSAWAWLGSVCAGGGEVGGGERGQGDVGTPGAVATDLASDANALRGTDIRSSAAVPG